MSDHRSRFLQLALNADALRFGQFTLKSGRVSPYFFNAGRFDTGLALAQLGNCYADAVEASGIAFDQLFGPAYKGIPLATAIACAFSHRGRNLPLTFNRKEAKDHGEGGNLIGADMAGRRILIIDDVITAGTAIREALAIIRDAGGIPAGIVVALGSAGNRLGNRPSLRRTSRGRRNRHPGDCRGQPHRPACVRLREPRNLSAVGNRCWPTVASTEAIQPVDRRGLP